MSGLDSIIDEMTQLKLDRLRYETALRMILEICERGGCRCVGGIFCSTCEAKAAAIVGLRK